MGGENVSEPMEAFEVWLIRLVAQAVEAGEVPAKLLMDLQAALEVGRAVSQEAGHAAAIRQIADIAEIPEEQAAEALAKIEAEPTVTREILMRRIAEAWLEGQRKAFRGR